MHGTASPPLWDPNNVSGNIRRAMVRRESEFNRERNSDYSRETERRVEQLLAELYETLQIRRPDDLYGSVVIEMRYQGGRPVGQVDVNVRYVMKRNTDVPGMRRRSNVNRESNGISPQVARESDGKDEMIG